MLKLILGPMKSGKSTKLLQEVERYQYAKMKAVILRPAIDTREHLTRIDRPTGAHVEIIRLDGVNKTMKDMRHFDVIGLDEFQFFSEEDLEWVIHRFRNERVVICAALNGTAEQRPWDNVQQIIPYVDDIKFLHAVCEECGNMNAAFSYYKGGKKDQIVIGDNEYQALCWRCLSKKRAAEENN